MTSAARLVHAGVAPPTTRGVSLCRWSGLPGSIRSGLNATLMSVPAVSPRCRSGSVSRSRVVPT